MVRVFSYLLLIIIAIASHTVNAAKAPYEFTKNKVWFTMHDGTRLAATIYQPVPHFSGEKFPVIMEVLPYRKDDDWYTRDYPYFTYFSENGFITVRLDVRGTGSSEGHVPPREYSDIELDDVANVIDQLSRYPSSNGNVGMYGISWSANNTILESMRHPPALKAILLMDVSDDLYYNDVHYIDGVFHIDPYEIEMDHELGMPKSPEYRLDADYFENRFTSYPWFLVYLHHQTDGDFWKMHSAYRDYSAIQVPVYVMGGALDGYRDSVPHILDNVKTRIKASFGPWNHSSPDGDDPGPHYEWRREAINWWNCWLAGKNCEAFNTNTVSIYMRSGNAPDINLKTTPGKWRYEDWPITRTQWQKYFFTSNHQLLNSSSHSSGKMVLPYLPSSGIAAGDWWGDLTGNMANDDKNSFVFDSPVVTNPIEIIGMPTAYFSSSLDTSAAQWSVRLEDVFPDGKVSLVTGGALNGSQYKNRYQPELLTPNQVYPFKVPMHFTTWTFQPGHKIRLAITNAQFYMLWPSAHNMTSTLYLGANSYLDLPSIPFKPTVEPVFPSVEPYDSPSNAKDYPTKVTNRVIKDKLAHATTFNNIQKSGYEIDGNKYVTVENLSYTTHDNNPADSSYNGDINLTIAFPSRILHLETLLNVQADEKNFHVIFTRAISENGTLIKKKTWDEWIPREYQ